MAEPTPSPTSEPVLSIRDLVVSYERGKSALPVLDGVDIDIERGSVLGLVGESGSGKSTLARAVTGLVERRAGTVRIAGQDVPKSQKKFPTELRRHVQMVFQDPYSSLDPTWPIWRSVAEPLTLEAGSKSLGSLRERALSALEIVGIDPSAADRRPNAFSGGQRQRIAIARAISVEPDLLICDEPVSALDVSTQNQILSLLRDLRERLGVAILFISHDLAVVRQISTNVAVMYLGKVVEAGPVETVLSEPLHPYSRILRDAAPHIGRRVRAEQSSAGGEVSARRGPDRVGCVFMARCPLAVSDCGASSPVLELHTPSHAVACFRSDETIASSAKGGSDVE